MTASSSSLSSAAAASATASSSITDESAAIKRNPQQVDNSHNDGNDKNDNDDDIQLPHLQNDNPTNSTSRTRSSWSGLLAALQFMIALGLLYSAFQTRLSRQQQQQQQNGDGRHRRRLASAAAAATGGGVMSETNPPTYMKDLMQDLQARIKLMEETPPEEVKYWFEYTGPLQKYFYRFSKSRQKADYFEGRDDSGVTSARYDTDVGAGSDFVQLYHHHHDDNDTHNTKEEEESDKRSARTRMLEHCLAMGAPARPNVGPGTIWFDWFGKRSSSSESNGKDGNADDFDRCRILVTMNMVGAGRGSTMLWETLPPAKHAQGPAPWTSEQETAASHLQRNLQELDHMCATGLAAVRVQILVCEPIPAKWTEWMDSMLVNCGGKPAPMEQQATKVEERPSPVQIVVMANAATADVCHDLKSGFMEKRMQDLIVAPPLGQSDNPAVKTTLADLISSDDHDLYVAMKWSSLVTIRAVHAFLQASADLAAAAASPLQQTGQPPALEVNANGNKVAMTNAPGSPFLIPSFVRVSYVSEENSKVAKWRMHGDFFHPAAWEICKDSFDVTWIPHSLSAGGGGVHGICYDTSATTATAQARQLTEQQQQKQQQQQASDECGQWWIYMSELQMPTSPEVYANEVTPPLVHGGSNYIWMLTERQRREIVKTKLCEYSKTDKSSSSAAAAAAACPPNPQAVMPLGDIESFLINFTPNTALGKRHVLGRRPGYSREKESALEREKVRERKQLKDQADIEKALFEYTIYPSALFRKDATIKAARARDVILTKDRPKNAVGPQTVKSSYYDVTITKPRQPVPSWCQAIARKGLCTLYADYFRTSTDQRCLEACGMKKNWALIEK